MSFFPDKRIFILVEEHGRTYPVRKGIRGNGRRE